jgi:3'-phosphoadenosine 5'-phosphosulfate sulfotransferase (PAPS reductase)/FAD synthetase
MAARWSTRELTTLSKNLVDGFPVQHMMNLIPHRSAGAIIKQASRRNDYGIKTSKADRITRFYNRIDEQRGVRRFISKYGRSAIIISATIATFYICLRYIF